MSNSFPENPFSNLKARSIFLWLIFLSILGLILVTILSIFLDFDANDPIMSYVFYCLTFGLLCIWLLKRFRQLSIPLDAIIGTLPKPYSWIPLITIVVAVVLFSFGSFLISCYLLGVISPSLLESFIEYATVDNSELSAVPFLYNLIETFSIIIVAPITEEFVFRGVLLHRWGTKWGLIAGIIVSSVVFGILHANPIGLTMFGVVMALLYIKTATLIIPILAHGLNNLIAISLQFLPVWENMSSPHAIYSYLIPGLLFIAISVPFLFRFFSRYSPNSQTVLPYFKNFSQNKL